MSVQPATLEPLATPRQTRVVARRFSGPSPIDKLGYFVSAKPLGAFGGFLVVLFLVVAATAQWIAPYPYDVGTAADRLLAPSLAHPFGTDANGRDLLSRVIWGARVSVTIGFGAVLIS